MAGLKMYPENDVKRRQMICALGDHLGFPAKENVTRMLRAVGEYLDIPYHQMRHYYYATENETEFNKKRWMKIQESYKERKEDNGIFKNFSL